MLTGILLVKSKLPGRSLLLAVSGLAESEPYRTTVATAAHSARTGVGRSPRRGVDHAGHRYHGAHALWPADGGPQRDITRKTKARKAISPFSPFSSRKPIVPLGRLAQWPAPRWEADRAPSPQCDRRVAQGYPEDFRPGRFRFFLLGGRASLPKSQGALHHRGRPEPSRNKRLANRRLEALAQDRRH